MYLNRRDLTEKCVILISSLAALAVVGVLFMIVGEVFIGGLPSLSWYFITTSENATPGMGQGIANAIIGTIMISVCATVVAAPFGLGTAIYMKRYAPDNAITRGFRFLLEVLSGTPSIVVGIFGFLVFVYYIMPFSGGFSLIAAALALAILIMPVIERAIEEAVDTVSLELEEGSYALGATKWQTIRDITIPAAFTGLLTSFTLGFGRAAEESAVVILTAGYTQYMPELTVKQSDKLAGGIKIYPIQDQVATLPYAVYHAFQNANVVKPSAGFAAAFVLIVIVFSINITGKALLRGTQSTGKTAGSWFHSIKAKIFSQQNNLIKTCIPEPGLNIPGNLEAAILPTDDKFNAGGPVSISLKEQLTSIFSVTRKNPESVSLRQDELPKDSKKANMPATRIFLRTLFPFAITAALLLLTAFLATIPPLHHALGTASPFLAGLFGAGLALIIITAGLVFALLFAKRAGAFRRKTRRIGYAGVAAGFCLVCIAGIICASAAAGIFSTGAGPAQAATGDRNSQLAALLPAGEPGSGGSEVQVQEPSAQAPATPASAQGNESMVSVPRKDALSIGESYWWGDAEHTCRATIYDYKVLPFYFWWWIDYNRFVLQVPAANKSYLVVFVRIENTGTQSAIVPSADAFNVSYHDYFSGRLPYLNTSVISTWQSTQLGTVNRRDQYYQWIREIGQDKRDYAYLTGENLFKSGNSSAVVTLTPTVTVTTSTTSTTLGTTNSTGYGGAYLKPGRSQAIDGYLIFEVPYEATTHLDETYVDVSFNSLSNGRWKLG